ncbi:hypothetical protein, partial [Corallococcus terminator]
MGHSFARRGGVQTARRCASPHPRTIVPEAILSELEKTGRPFRKEAALLMRLQEGRPGQTPLFFVQPIGGT